MAHINRSCDFSESGISKKVNFDGLYKIFRK